MEVSLGHKKCIFPSEYLQELTDVSSMLDDVEQLRKELNDKGYLYIKNFHKRSDVLEARKAILQHLHNQGPQVLDTDKHGVNEGVLNQRCGLGCLPFMEGRNEITHSEQLRKVIEGKRAFDFFDRLFGEEPTTFDFKWLRAMHRTGFTGAHVDRVYMGRGSSDLLTMWTPLGDIPVSMGVLAVCEGSHNGTGFGHFQRTYSDCDLEREGVVGTGWFSENPAEISGMGGQWKTTDFKAGDVLIFNMRLVHMSTVNSSEFVRLSCDTRWQPRAQKADDRFMGNFETSETKFGVYARSKNNDQLTIEKLKKKWQLDKSNPI